METLDEIAAISDLVMINERAIEIGPHLATHCTPKLVEGVILAKVTSRPGSTMVSKKRQCRWVCGYPADLSGV
jgi:hypothetical protein